MKILGIDPGYDRIGIAIIEKSSQGKETYVFSECFQTKKSDSFAERLCALGEHLAQIIVAHTPAIAVIEKLYLTQNQKTAMGVSEARGVLVYEVAKAKLTLIECTPMEIKMAVTGFGKASKNDIALFVPKLIPLPTRTMLDDEMDAIAIALAGSALSASKNSYPQK